MSKSFALFLSCEHASNAVPDFLKDRFESSEAKAALETHRGYDIGAAAVFRALVQKLKPAFSLAGTFSRLCIDLNRNSNKNGRYSEWTENADLKEKARLESLSLTYRESFLEKIREVLSKENATVLHLSIHSFTPVLNGEVRNADLGLLYDPARHREKVFAEMWKRNLKNLRPNLRVRFNYPYLGKTDGHATALRKLFSEEEYVGFEVEMNQALLMASSPEEVAETLSAALSEINFFEALVK